MIIIIIIIIIIELKCSINCIMREIVGMKLTYKCTCTRAHTHTHT